MEIIGKPGRRFLANGVKELGRFAGVTGVDSEVGPALSESAQRTSRTGICGWLSDRGDNHVRFALIENEERTRQAPAGSSRCW